MYVWNALSKFCNPDVSIVFLFLITITCSGILRFSILAIKNPVTLTLTFRNFFSELNLLHCISLFLSMALLRLCYGADELEYNDTVAVTVSCCIYGVGGY